MEHSWRRTVGLRLARAFADEATRLRDDTPPVWCTLSRQDIERYAREAIGSLHRYERAMRHPGRTAAGEDFEE